MSCTSFENFWSVQVLTFCVRNLAKLLNTSVLVLCLLHNTVSTWSRSRFPGFRLREGQALSVGILHLWEVKLPQCFLYPKKFSFRFLSSCRWPEILPLPTPLTTSPSAHHLALSACFFSSLLSLSFFLFFLPLCLFLCLPLPLFISFALSRAVFACQPPVNILPAETESEMGLSHSLTAVGSLFSTPLQSLEGGPLACLRGSLVHCEMQIHQNLEELHP